VGKIRDTWRKAKDRLTSQQAQALPKEDLGPKCDTFETLCDDLAAKLTPLAAKLAEWDKAWVELNNLAGKYGAEAAKAKLPNEVQSGVADVLRLIRGYGKKVHTPWSAVKDADIKKYRF
jgi:hypothetical protein